VTSLDDPDLNFYQTYRLEKIKNGRTEVLTDRARHRATIWSRSS
jgi:hypothetical protein